MEQATAKIHAALDKSSKDLLDSVAGMPPEIFGVRPGEGRWCVLDCVEHVIMVEEIATSRFASAARLPQPSINEQREDEILSRLPLRIERFKGPEAVQPRGAYPNLKQALDAFLALRERTAVLVEERAADLRSLQLNHPVLGPVTGYEMLLLLAAHASRHANQIREVREFLQNNTAAAARS